MMMPMMMKMNITPTDHEYYERYGALFENDDRYAKLRKEAEQLSKDEFFFDQSR